MQEIFEKLVICFCLWCEISLKKNESILRSKLPVIGSSALSHQRACQAAGDTERAPVDLFRYC